MKRILKIFGAIAIAAVLTVGGYVAGSQNGMDSITSALPHVNITHGAPEGSPHASGAPDFKTDAEKEPLPPETDDKEPTEPEKTGRTVVKTNESAAKSNWTLVKRYDGSLMNNDDKSKLSVYTSAETIDGEIIWNDGQQWVVEVDDQNGDYYVLMDKYISNGIVYFEIIEKDGKTAINVFTKTCVGMDIKQYTYSKDGFTETTLYNSGTANTLYSSVPDYQ